MSTTSNEATRPPPSSGTRNRKDAALKEDLQKDRIKDLWAARAFLEGLSVIIIGEAVTTQSLILALQHLSQSTRAKQTLQNGIKGVAMLLSVASANEGADELARKVAERMAQPMDWLQSVMEGAKGVVQEIQHAIQEVKEEWVKTLQGLTMALGALEKAPTYVLVAATGRATTAPTHAPSCSREPPNMTRIMMLVKGNTKARQILVDEEVTEGGIATLAALTPAELVEKANLALTEVSHRLAIEVTAVTAN
ncbi:hypothetical protein M422DRAFT_254454 [Sphaerobolus stellatus SS14]|uniref:Unplaced genomic scaffold SPHSTscaffold_55, whole genome shotgun sequence n=1 Tax=Sphaerobolus stellatus (strain SS14) TaxID=990650 RepID=A0A0C9V609_SPHS4|nr:hypothetical protein M422DRAFT_254454 [Sphaerobolus stellatus SS14]